MGFLHQEQDKLETFLHLKSTGVFIRDQKAGSRSVDFPSTQFSGVIEGQTRQLDSLSIFIIKLTETPFTTIYFNAIKFY